jgi:FkbM family methyltransferase
MDPRTLPQNRDGLTAFDLGGILPDKVLSILEIGTHEGEDTEKFVEQFPQAVLHCFEPDERAALIFRGKFAANPLVYFSQVAIADDVGFLDFYASTGQAGGRKDWTLSGSLQKPTGHLAKSPEIQFKDPVKIPCVTLDHYFEEWDRKQIDFAWIDVQGAQLAVLEGAKETLLRIRYIYMECHIHPMYEGEPTQEDFLDLMITKGFEPMACYERYNFLFKNTRFSYAD